MEKKGSGKGKPTKSLSPDKKAEGFLVRKEPEGKQIVKKVGIRTKIQNMGVKMIDVRKESSESGPSVKVSFRLPKELAGGAEKVTLVGDFNGWNEGDTPMKRLKNGDFEVSFTLHSGREYRYKYLIDGCRWENDLCADDYKPNPFGGEDSIVLV